MRHHPLLRLRQCRFTLLTRFFFDIYTIVRAYIHYAVVGPAVLQYYRTGQAWRSAAVAECSLKLRLRIVIVQLPTPITPILYLKSTPAHCLSTLLNNYSAHEGV